MENMPVDLAAVTALEDTIEDIVYHMREREPHCMPNIKTMDTQPEYRWFMRPQLLGFMLQSQHSLGLGLEVFSLAVNILDRYASRRIVNGRHHQLVGAVCVWLAAKFLDLKQQVPTVRDIEYICAGAFPCTVIAEMELHILSALDWEISAPTAVGFVDFVVSSLFAGQTLAHPDPTIYCCLAKHICECALFKRDLLGYLPSVLASTAVEVACVIVDVCCGVDRQFEPVDGSCRQLFDELASLIVAPPIQIQTRATAYQPYDVVALLAQFVHMSRDDFSIENEQPPQDQDLQQNPSNYANYYDYTQQQSPTYSSSCSEWTSPATVVSVDTSPFGAGTPEAKHTQYHHQQYSPMHNYL